MLAAKKLTAGPPHLNCSRPCTVGVNRLPYHWRMWSEPQSPLAKFCMRPCSKARDLIRITHPAARRTSGLRGFGGCVVVIDCSFLIQGTPVSAPPSSGPNQRDARSYTKGSGVSTCSTSNLSVSFPHDVPTRTACLAREQSQGRGRRPAARCARTPHPACGSARATEPE